MFDVGVVGGTGYTGKELIRLIVGHPEFDLAYASSRKRAGESIGDVHPNLRGLVNDVFIPPSEDLDCDLVFLAVPHTKGMEYVPDLREKGIKVVDLSADYRVSPSTYDEHYSREHIDRDRKAVYGLVEYNREKIRDSDFVANPGCFPTGALLSVLPLVEEDFSFERILFDSKTGISGAGASASETTHFPNVDGEICAYDVVSHRHLAEIGEVLGGNDVEDFGFTPHIVPLVRGILTTTHVFSLDYSKGELIELYNDFFNDSVFVRVFDEVPKLKSVKGTNFVDIGGFGVGNDRVVILSSIDNLVKGASGQAVQNANLMLGLDEELGLLEPGLAP